MWFKVSKASELSIELREYLKRCGLSERNIARCSGNTRMYHDLGLYGDVAEAYIVEALADHYHVDLSGFEFDKFFPAGFPGKNAFIAALFSIVPFAGYVAKQRGEYLPLTLEMIENVMRAKQWRAVAPMAEVIRQYSLRHLAEVFGVPEASLFNGARFGQELKAAPASDFKANEFDIIDGEIKDVADKRRLKEMMQGVLVIQTVGDYCEHMVLCSVTKPEEVARILRLPATK